MQYWLEISNTVRRQIERIPGHRRQHIKRIIASLRVNPRPSTASELRNRPGAIASVLMMTGASFIKLTMID